MLGSLLFLAQAATAPTPAPAAVPSAPVVSSPAPALASAPQPAAAAPTPAGPRTLGDLARERKLNRTGTGGGTMSSAYTRGAAPLPDAPPSPKPGSKDDLEGQWRARAADLRERAEKARAELSRMESQIPIVYTRNGDVSPAAWAAREAALAPYRMKLEDVTAEQARLPEECRTTSGCAPGWIR